MDCFVAPLLAMTEFAANLKHLEIFAMLPVRHLGLKPLDLGVLDVNVIVDELCASDPRKNGSSLSAVTASRSVFGSNAALVSYGVSADGPGSSCRSTPSRPERICEAM